MPEPFDLSRLLDPNTYSKSIGNLLRNYAYQATATLRNPDTGEVSEQFITVSTNEILTEEEILATVETYSKAGNYGETVELDTIAITDALRSKALGE